MHYVAYFQTLLKSEEYWLTCQFSESLFDSSSGVLNRLHAFIICSSSNVWLLATLKFMRRSLYPVRGAIVTSHSSPHDVTRACLTEDEWHLRPLSVCGHLWVLL